MKINSTHNVRAILGPTNTGKTWSALEAMCSYESGMIGFPLRLLARENYDKLVERLGLSRVALITGEEKIIPAHASYYVCTVESMPVTQAVEFVAVDEVQLATDPDRGHIFTDRILRLRGSKETMFMGSDTMRSILKSLIPDIHFETRPRLSNLQYTGFKKISRLPRRSAVVAFSVNDVYRLAEAVRRERGGTAIVLGALSPRARNAQVDLYQSGEVDYLIATDAIGMGLNMDIKHVALSATRKFDGRHMRDLHDHELGQIAGRAGRYMDNGSFGVTDETRELSEDTIQAIENHQYPPVRKMVWRSSDLDYASATALMKTLKRNPDSEYFIKGRPAIDMQTLEALNKNRNVMELVQHPGLVRLLWDVCQIPDFRKTISDSHVQLCAEVFSRLSHKGKADKDDVTPLDEDWLNAQIKQLDRIEGDPDSLMSRLAHIRTWTYITHRPSWIRDAAHWQLKTRQIEDKLSDALHQALVNRFVDKRNSVLTLAVENKENILGGVQPDGTVVVEGEVIGWLKGLAFHAIKDKVVSRESRKIIYTVARHLLAPEIERRLHMLETGSGRFTLQDDGRIFWQEDATNPLPGDAVARLQKGDALLEPKISILDAENLEGDAKTRLQETTENWLKAHIQTVLEPLVQLVSDPVPKEGEETITLEGPAKGIAFQIHEALGVIDRSDIDDLIQDLTPDHRKALRRYGVRLGPVLCFQPALVKPAAIRLRALLWGLYYDRTLPVEQPDDGRVSVVIDPAKVDRKFYRSIGYPVFGNRAIRINMLDRVVTDVYDSADKGIFQAKHSYAEWLGCSLEDLYSILTSMGHYRLKEETTDTDASTDVNAAPAEEQTDETTAADEAAAQVKPELPNFRLKKGKLSEKPQRKPHPASKAQKQSKKPHKQAKGKKDSGAKVYSAPAKEVDEDSPFAILQQLKQK